MLDAGAAVIAAQRPAALAQMTGTVGAGHTLTLDGSHSGASIGRAPLTYMWTVLSVDGGAATPMIQSPDQAVATVLSPSTGSYSISLTVTDNVGATDSAIVTVSAGSTGSTSPPPATGKSGGGGSSPGLLILFALLLLARGAHARWRART
jgi:hypothetical protein